MTSRFAAMAAEHKKTGQKALIPFTLLGWPNADTSFSIIEGLIAGGASALELGIAFSDPMADGPVIQQAAGEVLKSGFRVSDALVLIKKLRDAGHEIPIGLLVYYNVVLSYGIERWFADLKSVGADVVMVVDLPLEHADEIDVAAKKFGIGLAWMVSPLTTSERIEQMASFDPAFLYVVSRLGVTGTQSVYDQTLEAILQQVKQSAPCPAYVGFGISTPTDVEMMAKLGADGVVVGSAVIKTVQAALLSGKNIQKAVELYIQTMQASTTPKANKISTGQSLSDYYSL